MYIFIFFLKVDFGAPLVYRAPVHTSIRGVHDFVVGMSPRFDNTECGDSFDFIRISTYLNLIKKTITGDLCLKDVIYI